MEDIDGHRAPVCRTLLVQFEDFRDFVGGPGATVEPARDIDGGRLDTVPVHPPEHFLFGNILMDDHGVVNKYLGDTRVLGHDGNKLEFFVEGLFPVGSGLPFGPLTNLFHLVGRAVIT